jgi:pimeloyl-ACP methyl ester carboxylesterase
VSLPPILLAVLFSACAHRGPVVDPARTALYSRQITLYQHPLDVHLARPRQIPAPRPMLLYATGDGGFRGNDRAVFDALVSFGYPVAGFSARNYLKNLGYVADTTTPGRLARDYQRLIDFSAKALELPPNTPVILVGVSRGAGLAVVAAGQRVLRDKLAGVLAIALTREEEYVRHYRVRRGQAPPGTPQRELVMVETYDYLPQLLSLPVSVIQSTHDGYLPADKARELFGPDTNDRQLHAIDALDHSFNGAREELYQQMEQALTWIDHFLLPSPRADR